MAFLCAICKRPLRSSDLVAKLNDKFVHLDHHGVRKEIGGSSSYASKVTLGVCLELASHQQPVRPKRKTK